MPERKLHLTKFEKSVVCAYGHSPANDNLTWIDDGDDVPLYVKALINHRHGAVSGYIHYLKIDPEPMGCILTKEKKAEIRINDRNFGLNDVVFLQDPFGRTATRKITHIQKGYGIPEGYVILSYASGTG